MCDRTINFIDDDEYYPDTPCNRVSMDNSNCCNSHGLKLIDLCKSNGLRIANGRLGEDHLIGSYTYANYMGSSVIDYLLLHEHDFHCIDNFHVNPFSEWSDHAA